MHDPPHTASRAHSHPCHTQQRLAVTNIVDNSRDMIETLALIFLWQTLPVQFCSLQQAQRTHHVSTCESERILYRAIYMALCSKMDDTVYLVFLHNLLHTFIVAYVSLYEHIVKLILYVFQVRQVAGISQLVRLMILYSGYLFTNRRTTCEPMKPAQPVIRMLRLSSCVYLIIIIVLLLLMQ